MMVAEFDLSVPCEAVEHAQGAFGCVPEKPAEFAVEVIYCRDGNHDQWAQQVFCQGRVIWLRGRLESTVNCAICGKPGTVGEFIRVVGPIAQLMSGPFEARQ